MKALEARRRLAAGLLVGGLALSTSAAGGPSDAERRLQGLQRAIDSRRERVEAYERRERGLLDTLEEIDRTAEALSDAVAQADAEAQTARRRLASLEAHAGEMAQRRDATRRAMAARAVALYEAGEVGPVRVLFSAGDVRELLARVSTLRFLLAHDAELLDRFRAESAELEQARGASRTAAAAQERALAELGSRSRELERERAARARVLASVRTDREREQAALRELEAAARALEETLDRLGRTPAEPGSRPPPGALFASLRGRLEAPVDAPVLRGFGRVVDAEFGTETFRKGVDFGAPLGTPVHAVADGTVRYAGWFRGYGKLAIVDHGDGYFTVLGHLGELRVAVGDAVHAGDVLGSVGDTGSLSGPVLYFEIRKASEPLDPLPWLRAARRLE